MRPTRCEAVRAALLAGFLLANAEPAGATEAAQAGHPVDWQVQPAAGALVQPSCYEHLLGLTLVLA